MTGPSPVSSVAACLDRVHSFVSGIDYDVALVVQLITVVSSGRCAIVRYLNGEQGQVRRPCDVRVRRPRRARATFARETKSVRDLWLTSETDLGTRSQIRRGGCYDPLLSIGRTQGD